MTRFRSLRWRLTLAFVGLLALLIAGLGVYQYFSLRTALIDSRVATFRDDLSSGVAVFRSGAARTSGTGPVERLATAVSTASGHTVSVVLYDGSGRRLGAVASDQGTSAGDLPQLDPATLQSILRSKRSASAIIDGVKGPELVAGFWVDAPLRGSGGVAQLSAPMSQIDDVLNRQLLFLVIGSAIAVLLAVIIGLVLTGRTLGPLHRLTATADRLAAGDLRARSQLQPRSDEVGHLTTAFDHMADRIEEAFTAQAESEAKVRRFIADASHELRTPVTALKGYIDVMRRGAGRDPATLEGILDSMGRESERMRILVLDLLTLARLDAAQGAQKSEEVELVGAVSRLLDEGVPGAPPQVERRFPGEPVTVRGDAQALATIVRNLMVNAAKYAPGARQVWGISVRDGMARLDAHDEGPGIPAADLPHVFERFYRGEKTRAREEGGSGLGLSIVEGLARAQGGHAAIASTEGVGTTVSIFLPLAGNGHAG